MKASTRQTESRQVSPEQIALDLRQLGLQQDNHVALGVSLKSIGRVVGGPNALIDTLLDVVGARGTIMIPTFTATNRGSKPRHGGIVDIYDPRTTPCDTGIVAETLRQRSDAVRSLHPSNSVAAIGAKAEFLTAAHDASTGAYAPYSRLAEIGGLFLGIGIGNRLVGLRHEAQARAGLLDVVPLRRAVRYLDRQGQIQIFIRRDVGGCTVRLEELADRLRGMGVVRDGRVGNAESLLVSARAALEQMTIWLHETPSLSLCHDVRCLWCRELERRLGLYDQIENPAWFQRSRLARFVIGQVNRCRLWRNR